MYRIIFSDDRKRVTCVEESATRLYNQAINEAGLGCSVTKTVAEEPGLVGLVTTYQVSAK